MWVSCPGSRPIRFITLAQCAIEAARVAILDHTLAKDPRIASCFSRWGPEIWRGLQHHKEDLELMKARGLDTLKDMSWDDVQERTSPYQWQVIVAHIGSTPAVSL